MAATLGRIVWAVTVDATNLDIDFTRAGVKAAALTAGTYATPELLAAAVVTALEAADAVPVWAAAVSAAGLITISSDLSFDLLWNTGAGAATSAKYLLGWTDDDVAAGTSLEAPNQHQGGFYFGETGPDLEFDSREMSDMVAPQSVSLGRVVTQFPTGTIGRTREMKISFMDEARTYVSTNNEKSGEDLYNYLMGSSSRYFTYAPDASSLSETDYHVVPSDGVNHTYKPIRPDPSVELWEFSVLLRKKV